MPSYTTLVGLGTAHQSDRKRHLAALAASPGQPCPRIDRCGGAPMYATPAQARAAGLPYHLWKVDLGDFPGRIFGGPQVKRLEHATCNRSAGAAMGNRLRAMGIKRRIRKPPSGTRRRSRW